MSPDDAKKHEMLLQIGSLIRTARDKAGITQTTLYDKMFLGNKTATNAKHRMISGYERGESTIPLFNLYRIAEILQIDFEIGVNGIHIIGE